VTNRANAAAGKRCMGRVRGVGRDRGRRGRLQPVVPASSHHRRPAAPVFASWRSGAALRPAPVVMPLPFTCDATMSQPESKPLFATLEETVIDEFDGVYLDPNPVQ
jgi:hypothetical protein